MAAVRSSQQQQQQQQHLISVGQRSNAPAAKPLTRRDTAEAEPSRAAGAGAVVWQADLAAMPAERAAAALADLQRRARRVRAIHAGPAAAPAAAPCSSISISSSSSSKGLSRGGLPRRRRSATAPQQQEPAPVPSLLAAQPAARLVEAVSAALAGGRELRALRIGVALPRAAAARLAGALAGNASLRELSLRARASGGAGDSLIEALSSGLVSHPQLRALELSNSGITDAGARALARVLVVQTAIRRERAWAASLRCGGGGGKGNGGGGGGQSVSPSQQRHADRGDDGGGGGGSDQLRPIRSSGTASGGGGSGGGWGIELLLLAGNPGITDAGAGALAAAVIEDASAGARGGGAGAPPCRVRALDLRGCGLTPGGAARLRRALAAAAPGLVLLLPSPPDTGNAGCEPIRGAGDGGLQKNTAAAAAAAATAAASELQQQLPTPCEDSGGDTGAASGSSSRGGALEALQRSFDALARVVGALEARVPRPTSTRSVVTL